MKGAVLTSPRNVVVREVEKPSPKSDEVLIEVKAAGICGGDVRRFKGTPGGPYPIIMGHEVSGRVAELGTDTRQERSLEVGQRVVVEPFVVCQRCRACMRGDYSHCSEIVVLGDSREYPGSFAEFMVAKSRFTHVVPDSVDFAQAALVEPLSVSLHALKRADVGPGDFVVILGAGPIGLMTLLIARKLGAHTLVADTIEFRLKMADQLGADYVVDPRSERIVDRVNELTDHWGADVVLAVRIAAETIAQSVDLVHKGGTIVAVGVSARESDSINLRKVTLNELSFLGSFAYCWDYPAAIDLLGKRSIDVHPLITHEFKLSDASKALQTASESQTHGFLKGILKP